jgi:hypothetical protein
MRVKKGTTSELLTRSGKVNFQGVLGVNKKVVNWLKNSYSYANADANLP